MRNLVTDEDSLEILGAYPLVRTQRLLANVIPRTFASLLKQADPRRNVGVSESRRGRDCHTTRMRWAGTRKQRNAVNWRYRLGQTQDVQEMTGVEDINKWYTDTVQWRPLRRFESWMGGMGSYYSDRLLEEYIP